MSAVAHLVVLAALFTALRGRLPWTRLGGVVLGLLAVVALVASWSVAEVRARLANADLWPGVAFVWVAAPLAWWTMRQEQDRTTPIHEEDEPESMSRFVPVSPQVFGVGLVIGASALVSAPVGLPPDLASDAAGDAVPWFLLGLAELSRHVGPLLAWMLVPAASALALLAAPRLDTSEPETGGPFRGRRDEAPFFLWAWLGLGLAPLAAALFAPAPDALDPGPALAEWFWFDLLTKHEPDAWLLRELPGVLLLLALFVVLPIMLPRWSATRGVFGRHLRRMGRRRYALLCALLGVFMLVPLGLAMRALGFGPWLRLGEGLWGGGLWL